MAYRANIAILLGDPSGIGPELISKLLTKKELDKANIVVVGEKNILEDANKLTGHSVKVKIIKDSSQINFDGKTKFF